MYYDSLALTIKEHRVHHPEATDVLDELAVKMANSLRKSDKSLNRARFLATAGHPDVETSRGTNGRFAASRN